MTVYFENGSTPDYKRKRGVTTTVYERRLVYTACS